MVSEIVFRDVLNMAQTIGIIGTLALTFFFYKRHIRHLATDTETRILRATRSIPCKELAYIQMVILAMPEL
jgi:hypothetical protein